MTLEDRGYHVDLCEAAVLERRAVPLRVRKSCVNARISGGSPETCAKTKTGRQEQSGFG
jgi:hypothetical protein